MLFFVNKTYKYEDSIKMVQDKCEEQSNEIQDLKKSLIEYKNKLQYECYNKEDNNNNNNNE